MKDGTDTSQGVGQLISNINACQAVGDIIRTTLGPRGMDKLIYTGGSASISNDGAEILKLLDIVHPAAKVLVDIARSQDNEVGDGTTGVTLLACEFLKSAKAFIEDGEHPQTIIKGFRKAALLATKKIDLIKIDIEKLKELDSFKSIQQTKDIELRDILECCAATALNSKLIANNKKFFSVMCVDAINCLSEEDEYDLKYIGIKKVTGGSVTESKLIQGVAFKKTFSYAGFEQQPKKIKDPKVLVLNVELELKSEKDIAEVTVETADGYQSIVDAEWNIIYEKLENCVLTGAKIVLSRLPVGDLATQYFADRGIFCAGRVNPEDLDRVCQATGAKVTSTCNNIDTKILGTCGLFEEKQVGGHRFNFFTECSKTKTATILLRGGSKQFVEEAHRSIHDALMVVKRTKQAATIVPGGGAIEMIISKSIQETAKTIAGKQQLILESFAKSLEIIPRQLCDNAGLDSTIVLNKLRQKHHNATSVCYFGIDVNEKDICDTLKSLVWEPSVNKRSAIAAAAEAACLVLSVDETVKNPQSEQSQMGARGQLPGSGPRPQPMSAAMGGQGLKGMGQAMGGGQGVRMLKGKGGK